MSAGSINDISHGKTLAAPTSRFLGNWIVSRAASGSSSSTSVDPSESASSDVATVGDGEVTSDSK